MAGAVAAVAAEVKKVFVVVVVFVICQRNLHLSSNVAVAAVVVVVVDYWYYIDLNNFVDCDKSVAVAAAAVDFDCCNLNTDFVDYSNFVADYSIEIRKVVVVVNLICDDADYCKLNYCNLNCNLNLNCY